MINIRTIQHYMYCPIRLGLLEIEIVWAENVSVVLANIMHENVHMLHQTPESRPAWGV